MISDGKANIIGRIFMPEVIFDPLGNLLAQIILLGEQVAAMTEMRRDL